VTTIWSIRMLRLLALTAAAAMAIATGTAQARPDPGKPPEASAGTSGQVAVGDPGRPTGHAEQTRLDGGAAAPGSEPVRLVELRTTGNAGLDWSSAGLGALAAVAALVLAAGALSARRRGSRVRGAV
jgi:hypothetical protein